MYLDALINGQSCKIIDIHIDNEYVFVSYQIDSDQNINSIKKLIQDFSTILANNIMVGDDSNLPLNIDGYLNGNLVKVITLDILSNYAYFVYVTSDDNLRTVRKLVQSYDTVLLLDTIYQTSGTNNSSISLSGTANTIAKFTEDGSTIGDSLITDDGTNVRVTNTLGLQDNVPGANSTLLKMPNWDLEFSQDNTPRYGFNTPAAGDEDSLYFISDEGPYHQAMLLADAIGNEDVWGISYRDATGDNVWHVGIRATFAGRVAVGDIIPDTYKLEVDGEISSQGNVQSVFSSSKSAGREILEIRADRTIANGAGINLYGDGDSRHPDKIRMFTGGDANFTLDGSNIKIGSGATGVDYILKFDGSGGDCEIKWNEGEARLYSDSMIVVDQGAGAPATIRMAGDQAGGFNPTVQLYDRTLRTGYAIINDGIDGTGFFRINYDNAEDTAQYTFLEFDPAGPTVRLKQNSIIGAGAAGVDYTLTFDGETNDGVITWMGDEDYFKFSDDILMDNAERIYFRDSALYITSLNDGHLDLRADISIDLNTPTIVIGDGDVGTITTDGSLDGIYIYPGTSDGTDNAFGVLCGGGFNTQSRGGFVNCFGNERAGSFAGLVQIAAGQAANGDIELLLGDDAGSRVVNVKDSGGNSQATINSDGEIICETNKRVACGGGSTGSTTTANGTVTLEINGTSYYLLKASSA